MAIYIRRVGEVADGSVTADKIASGAIEASKLADNAVDLSTVKVTGELPTEKLANGAVVEEKLASLAVSTGKLKDQAVSLAKAQRALKIDHFIGDETEVSTLGTTEEDQKIFNLPKATLDTKGISPVRLHVNAEMKVVDGTSPTGTMKVYIDAEESARITLNTTSGTYEMVEGEADISDLASGKHTIKLVLVTDQAPATVFNDLIEIFFEK